MTAALENLSDSEDIKEH